MSGDILVIRFSSLGDIVLTSPTLLNLRINYPSSRLCLLTKQTFEPLAALLPAVDRIEAVNGSTTSASYVRKLLDIDSGNFQLVVDLQGKLNSYLARKFVSSQQNLVYPKRRLERAAMIRRRNKIIPHDYPHTIDLYNDVLTQLGKPIWATRPVMRRLPASSTLMRRLPDNTPIAVIAPGAKHPPKQWPPERFLQVAHHLYHDYNMAVAWCTPADSSGNPVPPPGNHDIPGGFFTTFAGLPLSELSALIARAEITIANDSGISHLSSAVGTPTVALFGPTHPALGFAPRGLFDRVVQVDEFCRPCSLHGRTPCYRDKQYCFDRIRPEMVVEAVDDTLAARARSRRAVFLDRDGTIMVDKNYLHDPDQVELIPQAAEAMKALTEAGFALVIVSNQSGVARGMFGVDDVERVNRRLISLLHASGVEVDGVYYCPYHRHGTVPEYTAHSPLRKPGPGMPELAARDLGIDLRRSYVIGDKTEDIWLARIIGAFPLLVRTGYGRLSEKQLTAYNLEKSVDITDDLMGAVARIGEIETRDYRSQTLGDN
jgi:D-glycero-D-manno-heptose 1,7-bisphosphate phosphatase